MKRIFNKEKCIKDLEQLDPWICVASKGWIDMCDGREVINGIMLGDKGEEYFVSNDWTDVVDDEKVTIDKQNNEKPVTTEGMDKASPCSRKVFSRDLYIEDMDKCVPEVDHSKTGWAMDCDGAEVIDGHAKGKKGVTYVVDDEWTKEVPVEAEESETEPKKEVKQKTKYIFSKEKFLATGETYYKWIDDCDGAEVLNGFAIGKSGTEYYMLPEWIKKIPSEEKPAKIIPTCKKIFSKDKYLKTGGVYYKWIDDCDWAEVINGMARGKSGKTFYMTDDWTVEVPAEASSYRIEINCYDNKTTAATLYKNGEKINETIARCSDKDTFDLFKGATLALNRLLL